ncbi:uncharacterized protein RJT20DRAFT_44567 [Scheffersomyces xylosifermentans]|uniref:uncharacterized protein n=1 Tax=Scheffersomyces xylosifermentans TaxID=1304137 RepID=UPI00315DAA2A
MSSASNGSNTAVQQEPAVENPAAPASAVPANGPPSENLAAATKQVKKRKLVKKAPQSSKLKFQVWLGGHLATIAFGSISFIFQILWLPNWYYINSIAYRLSLLGAIAALTATFSHKFGLHFLPSASTLVSHQNFQYLILANIWLFTFKSIFKIIPFFLIAILHIAKHQKIEIITKESEFLASIIAYDELILIVYLLLRTLFFRGSSGYQLTAFLTFYWVRILYNKETQTLFVAIVERLDGKISKVENPKVKHYWEKTKLFVEAKRHAEEE